MTTVTDISQLIIRVVDKLSQGGPTALDRDLADEYADLCVSINARLAQCSRMIDEGSSMQALMLAEEQPNLLDSVAAVSFAKSVEWQEACALNALRQAPKIDRSAVHKLNEVYTKGIRSDQTKALYKAFRAAMASRNDAEALDSIRAIARLDPSDSNAAEQLARLEKKRREDSVKALRTALANNDERLTLAWLEQCEKLQVSDAVEVASAKTVRERVKAREAKLEIEQILPSLKPLKEQGRWQQCGERAARVNSLATTYRLEMSAADAAEVAEAVAYFQSCRQEAIRNAQFKEAIASVGECADQIQGVPQAGSKQSLDKLEKQRLQIRKAYEKAKEFAMPIPDNLVERITRIAANLDSEIERKRKARKMRNLGLATSLTLLLVAAVAGGYYLIRAGQFANEAIALKESAKALPLRKLVEQLRGEYSIYTSVPSLKSAMLESEAWLQGVAAQEEAARMAIEVAAKLAASGFADHTPEHASSLFQQAEAAVAKLPSDLGDVLRPELVEPEGKLAIWIGNMRDGRVVSAREQIEQARDQAQSLAAADSAEQVRQALQPLADSVRALLRVTETSVQDMTLPDAMKSEVMDLAAKVDQAANSLSAYDAAFERVNAASTISEYTSAISKVAEVPLPRAPVVKAAQLLSAKNLTEHGLLGAMILPNEPAVWSATETAGYWERDLQPAAPDPSEIAVLRKLVNDNNLVGIHMVTIEKSDTLSGNSAKRAIYTRGKLALAKQSEFSETARGSVYDPALSPGQVNFEDKIFAFIKTAVGTEQGERVVKNNNDGHTQTDVSAALERLSPQQIVNSSGDKYTGGMLKLFDQVKNDDRLPPIAKAYVFQELSKIVDVRPNDWGLAWSPSLKSDRLDLTETSGRQLSSGDWMLPSKSQLGSSLAAWFSGKKAISYAAEQALNRRLAQAAVEGGLRVYGYIGEKGEFTVTRREELEGVDELWGLEQGTFNPKVVFVRDKQSAETAFVAVAKGASLSPVFASPIDKSSVLDAALRSAGVPEKSAAAYQGSLPPLFEPLSLPKTTQ